MAKTNKKVSNTSKKKVSKKTNSNKSIKTLLIVLVAVVVLGIGGWLVYDYVSNNSLANGINSSRYIVYPYNSDNFPSEVSSKTSAPIISNLSVKMNNSFTKNLASSKQDAVKLCQWRDGDYSYYQYYVGYVTNVPVSYETACKYDGNDLTITFSKSTTTETSVEKSLSVTEELVSSTTHTASVGVTITAGGGVSFLGTGGKASLALAAGWEGSWSNSTSVSTSDTYTTAEVFS